MPKKSIKDRVLGMFATGKRETSPSPSYDEQPQQHLRQMREEENIHFLRTFAIEGGLDCEPSTSRQLERDYQASIDNVVNALKREKSLSEISSAHWTPGQTLSPLERFYQTYIAAFDIDPDAPDDMFSTEDRDLDFPHKRRLAHVVSKDNTMTSLPSLNAQDASMANLAENEKNNLVQVQGYVPTQDGLKEKKSSEGIFESRVGPKEWNDKPAQNFQTGACSAHKEKTKPCTDVKVEQEGTVRRICNSGCGPTLNISAGTVYISFGGESSKVEAYQDKETLAIMGKENDERAGTSYEFSKDSVKELQREEHQTTTAKTMEKEETVQPSEVPITDSQTCKEQNLESNLAAERKHLEKGHGNEEIQKDVTQYKQDSLSMSQEPSTSEKRQNQTLYTAERALKAFQELQERKEANHILSRKTSQMSGQAQKYSETVETIEVNNEFPDPIKLHDTEKPEACNKIYVDFACFGKEESSRSFTTDTESSEQGLPRLGPDSLTVSQEQENINVGLQQSETESLSQEDGSNLLSVEKGTLKPERGESSQSDGKSASSSKSPRQRTSEAPSFNDDSQNDEGTDDTLAIDECGLLDVYKLKQQIQSESHQLQKCVAKYKSRSDKIERLQRYLAQLKKEKEELGRLLEGVDKQTAALRNEAADMRCTVTAMCDVSVATIGKETDAKRLEPACYRRYLNIRSLADASNALSAVRNRIKTLNDLEVLIYRKQLVLHHVLPSAAQEKAPRRPNRSANKGLKAKKVEQSSSGQTTAGSIVIEVVSPVAEPSTPSWSEEASHTDSPLTMSTPLSVSNDGTASNQHLPDTEV